MRLRRTRTRIRRRHAGVVVAAALAPVAFAGCGGDSSPHLARTDAAPLIALSKRIASESGCSQARDIRTLQRRANALVAARRVPSRLRATLLGGVAQLASQTPVCVPRVAPVALEPVVTPATTPRGRGHEKPEHRAKHHGKHHGHGEGD